jgi:hypothetical protein
MLHHLPDEVPKCKGTNIMPPLSGFMAQTSKKS